MKIATWNLQRLEKNKNNLVLEKLFEIDADIFILTETNTAIQLDNYNCISTELLPMHFDNTLYNPGEARVSILTKYNFSTQHITYDTFTTVCTDIETPLGVLTIYGSVVGIFGNRQPRFDNDLHSQLRDLEDLIIDKQICFAGDLNTTFAGRAWPSNKARQTFMEAFKSYRLTNTTANIADTVDHIVLSNDFLENKHLKIETWNADKKLSDHVGHVLTLKLMNKQEKILQYGKYGN